MGIFDRIKRLIQSNVNSTFDTRTVEDLLNSGDEELKRIIEELSGNQQQPNGNKKASERESTTNNDYSTPPPRQDKHSRSRNQAPSPQHQALLRAYSRLGVRSTSSNEEIKASYRKMIKLYHPDRVAQLDKVKQEEAKRIAQEINVAYDLLQKVRGFS